MKRNVDSREVNSVEQAQKEIFKEIKNYLAGRFVGATRDRALLEEVVKCFFCKHYLLTHFGHEYSNEDGITLSKKYREVFSELKKKLPFVFYKNEEIQLDPISIQFVDKQLNRVDIINGNRDSFGDLYEVFVNSGVREEEGQFFTPQNGIELLISLVNPKPGEKIIDPAAGAGGFLSGVYKYLKSQNTSPSLIVSNLIGIEKDNYLAKLAATRISLMSLLECNIYCGDSLSWVNENDKSLKVPGDCSYDIVLTNPPFGKNIVATNKEVQKTFELGFEWKLDTKDNKYVISSKLLQNVPPQVLFVEKCLSLLKEGGRLGMVVPESLITSKSYSYVVQYMRSKGVIKSIIGMPEDFFKTSGKGGTHTKACLILFEKHSKVSKIDSEIFMAEAKWCGHDSRGRSIEQDDLPQILSNYLKFSKGKKQPQGKLGYSIISSKIENNILSPRYYNPEISNKINAVKNTHEIIRFGDLIKQGVLELKTGNEAGKSAYGSGNIPFVRTSDISNWEIKLDPKQGLSEEHYLMFSGKQDVKENDILMVKDGTYLIGTCAMITKYDTKIVYQSHLYKIRVLDDKIISPYLLLAILSSEPVQQQIKSKRFTQDIIDSLGTRINDLLLPIPKDKKVLQRIESNVKKAIKDRIEARELARQACLEVAAIDLSD